jgi:hypothetical protein
MLLILLKFLELLQFVVMYLPFQSPTAAFLRKRLKEYGSEVISRSDATKFYENSPLD